jgi:thymidylate kinase
MSESNLKIGLVGVCGAGKTTLITGLKPYYKNVRQIAQEHSYVPDMWQRLVKPDVLIFLQASYPITLQRKSFTWTEKEYQAQKYRLRHAFKHADIHIDTDNISSDEILRIVLKYIEELDR